jgi:putative heme-binding domain-containing protein
VLSERYTRRNPHVAPADTVVQMTEPNPKVFPLSRGQARYHSFEQAGHFTSACATMVYRDELLFPRDGSRQHFVCEPMHNVVQHRVSRERGTTFTHADRAPGEELCDFLASDDEWFRPVNLNTGPDGALYVVDMYRYMIEHPDWLPKEGKDDFRPFYRTGHDRGRIWRIVPKGQHARAILRLDKLQGAELAAKLDSPNGWQRDIVQQLIVWRKDAAAVPKLQELLTSSTNPLARLHALCTLDGLGAITPELVVRGMGDENAGVRMNAIRVAVPLGKTNPGVVEAAAKLLENPDAKVRLQLACSLGEWPTPPAAATLGKLAAFNADDPYISAAVMSSAVPHYAAIPQWLLAQAHTIRGPMYRDLLAMALAVADRDVMAKLLTPVVEPIPGVTHDGDQLIAWAAWLDLLASRGQSIEQITKTNDALAKQLAQAGGLTNAARVAAIDEKRSLEERSAAVSLLGRDPKQLDADLTILAGLFTPNTPPPVQRAAVQSITRTAGDKTPGILASNWAGMSPEIRVAAIDLLLGQEPWAFELLKQVEAGRITAAEIDVPRRQRLEKLGSARVTELAKKLLGATSSAARDKVVEAYKPALELTGDVQRGQKVYTQNCAVCHRLGDQGNEIGPDLRSVRDWPADSILANVLDPNRKVEPRYLGYAATLNNGQILFGIIAAETASSLTIKGLDGKDTTVLRADVNSLEGTNKSLMPDGLEAAVNQQQMADLIRFLKEPPATAH